MQEKVMKMDRSILTTVLAWESVFGFKHLTWGELSKMGLTLNHDEALNLQKVPSARRDLYKLLFEYHRSLKVTNS